MLLASAYTRQIFEESKAACQYPKHSGENKQVKGRDVVSFADGLGHPEAIWSLCSNRNTSSFFFLFHLIWLLLLDII